MKISRIGIFIFPDVEELDFVGVYEVLGAALRMLNQNQTTEDTPFAVDVLAAHDLVTCANGLNVVPHRVGVAFNSYDMLIVPGGKGVRALMQDDTVLSKLHDFSAGGLLCSVCTGALLLGAAGLLTGRRATTHAGARNELRQYCEVVTDTVVDEGNIITAAGVTSSIALGVFLLRKMFGNSIAEDVADRLEIPDSLRTVRGQSHP